jgi:hypothetical protein
MRTLRYTNELRPWYHLERNGELESKSKNNPRNSIRYQSVQIPPILSDNLKRITT